MPNITPKQFCDLVEKKLVQDLRIVPRRTYGESNYVGICRPNINESKEDDIIPDVVKDKRGKNIMKHGSKVMAYIPFDKTNDKSFLDGEIKNYSKILGIDENIFKNI